MLDTLLKSLNIDPTVLLLNIGLFLVLLLVLNTLFWKPVMAHLEKRKHVIDDAYKTVDKTRREMENLRAEYQARLAKIEAEARGQIQTTVHDAQMERERLLAEAREQAEATIRQGQTTIAEERLQTLASMRAALDETAMSALSKALGAPAGAGQRQLVDEYISQQAARS